MKGAKLTGPGHVELQPIEKGAGVAALLSVLACGVCHSDRKGYIKPPGGMRLPRVLGHELVGEVLVDLPTHDLKRGDRVAAWPALVCGQCELCKTGRENLCGEIRLFGYHLDGGFAEKFSLCSEDIHKVRLLKLPESVSNEEAILLEPLACVVNAFSKLAGLPFRLLIVGAGLMGRLAARIAIGDGQSKVFFYDLDKSRLANAMVDGREFDGKECDAVLIAASGEGAVQYGLDHLAPGGTILLFSGQFSGLIEVDHNRIHQREQTLTGVYGCRFTDMEKALVMLEDGQVAVDDLISRRVTLTEISTELGKTMNHNEYKVVMVHQ